MLSLQACHPNHLSGVHAEVADLAEAIRTVFPAGTEVAYLTWNRVPVRLSYHHDVAALVGDLVPMLEAVRGLARGSTVVQWSSDTFRATWQLGWDPQTVKGLATWERVAGEYEGLLNERNILMTPRFGFLLAWNTLLRKVADGLSANQLTIRDGDLAGRLQDLVRMLPGPAAALPV